MTSSFDLNFYSEGGSIRRGELQILTGTREDAGPGDHQCDVFRRTHLCAAAREFLLLLREQFERCEIRIQRTAHHRFIIDVLENVMSGIGTNRFSKIFRQCTPRPAVRRNTIIAALSEEEVRDVVEKLFSLLGRIFAVIRLRCIGLKPITLHGSDAEFFEHQEDGALVGQISGTMRLGFFGSGKLFHRTAL